MTQPYPSPIPYEAARIHAAAVYCSDGRVGEHFDDFLTRGLGLPRYDRVALPGGPACLAGQQQAHSGEAGALDQLAFLVEAHDLDRVILIQHEGCAFYAQRLGIPPEAMKRKQQEDVAMASALIRDRTSVERVEAYFAQINGSDVKFAPIDPN